MFRPAENILTVMLQQLKKEGALTSQTSYPGTNWLHSTVSLTKNQQSQQHPQDEKLSFSCCTGEDFLVQSAISCDIKTTNDVRKQGEQKNLATEW